MNSSLPFWKTKPLAEMTHDEWESLCDGCAKCCLNKLEDEDTGKVFYTSVTCRLLDLETCRCTRYPDRSRLVPDCIHFDAATIPDLPWLPSTCAYRLVSEGKDLPDWHPLLSDSTDSVHQAGVSVRCFAQSEQDVDNLFEHILDGHI